MSASRGAVARAAVDLQEAADVKTIVPRLDDAVGGLYRLRARRTDRIGDALGDQLSKWGLRGRQAGNVRELPIGLEHDNLPRLNKLLAERARDLIAHNISLRQ
jgi:hypothetical protein